MTEQRKQLHIRVDSDLHSAVEAFADSTDRTTSGAAVHLIRKGLEAEQSVDSQPTVQHTTEY